MLHCFFSIDNAAAGGDHTMFRLQFAVDLIFYRQKTIRILFLEIILMLKVFLLLPGITRSESNKTIPEHLCQNYTNSTFAGARHSNKNDIFHKNLLLI